MVQAVTSWPSASTVPTCWSFCANGAGDANGPVIDHDYPASDDDRDEMFDDMPGAGAASPDRRSSE